MRAAIGLVGAAPLPIDEVSGGIDYQRSQPASFLADQGPLALAEHLRFHPNGQPLNTRYSAYAVGDCGGSAERLARYPSHWPADGDLLFSLKRTGTPITDMSLGKIVREAFATIGHEAKDMGPRILRNTYCRRLLLRGVAPDAVTERLGLVSKRTVARIAVTE